MNGVVDLESATSSSSPHSTEGQSTTLVDYLARLLQVPTPRLPSSQKPLQQQLGQLAQGLYLDFLLQNGGALSTTYVYNESQHTGRLWDYPQLDSLALSPCSSHLLETLEQAFRNSNQAFQIPPPQEGTGDVVFYHAMFRLTNHNFKLRRWVSALRKSSPLTRLVTFPIVPQHPYIEFEDGQEGRPSLTDAELDHLIQHPALPFLSGYLADEWSELPSPAGTKDFDPQLSRLNARRATLHQYMHRCDLIGKLSLLRPVLQFFQRLQDRKTEQIIVEVQQCRAWKISVRETMLRGYRGLLQLNEKFDELHQSSIIEPGAYGWEHPEEVRVLMKPWVVRWVSGGMRDRHLKLSQQFRASMG